MQPQPITESMDFAFMGEVKAGFPSPASDVRERLDLTKLLVRHSASTFFFRIDGVSMVDADMDEGDIIIVDRAVVKRVQIENDHAVLLPCNSNNKKFKPIPVGPENSFLIWGVVTWIVKKA